MPRPKVYLTEHRIANRIAAQMEAAFLNAVSRARAAVKLRPLANAVEVGNADLVIGAIPWPEIQDALTRQFEAMYLDGIGDAARQATVPAEALVQPIQKQEDLLTAVGFRFDLKNPETVNWAKLEAATLVVQVTEETRLGIRRVIQQMFEQGIPPARGARLIRSLIGLDERWAQAVMNYRLSLERANERRRIRPQRGFRTIDQDRIDTMVAKYEARLLRLRSERIARTESIRAAAKGQQEAWRQARRQGLLDPDRVGRVWIVTPDERLCPICAPMPSNPRNHPVGLEQPFETGDGRLVDLPPAHPQCRCAVRLIVKTGGVFPPIPKIIQAFLGKKPPRRRIRRPLPKR